MWRTLPVAIAPFKGFWVSGGMVLAADPGGWRLYTPQRGTNRRKTDSANRRIRAKRGSGTVGPQQPRELLRT